MGKVAFLQVGTVEVGTEHVGTAQIGHVQVLVGQVRVLEGTPRQISTSQVTFPVAVQCCG